MSQPVVEFRSPTEADIADLAANMREQDVAEVRACGHTDLHAVIADGVKRSTLCWSCFVDGELAAIFGCAPGGTMLDPTGVPWLLGTDLIPKHGRIFVRVSPPYIARMLAAFPRLSNAVHAENTVAVRWLRKVGFHLHPAVPVGPHGAPFHIFEMER